MRASSLRRRRGLLLAVVVGALAWTGGGAAVAQVPPVPSELPLPTPEPSSDPVPQPTPSGNPTPVPEPSPSGGSSEEPDPDIASESDSGAGRGPSGGQGTLPGFEVVPPDAGAGPGDPVGPAPEVAPGRDGLGGGTIVRDADGTLRMVPGGISPVAAALPGAYGIGLLAALLGVATIFSMFSLTHRGLLLATDAHGGTDVETTRRWRTTAGIALLAAATLVGIIGYMKISVETLVPVQVVYLASAGFGVVILAAAGGALLVSEQLRADEDRLTEIEAALATIAGHLAPGVAAEPRLLDRSNEPTGDAPAADPDATQVISKPARKAAGRTPATGG